MKAYIIDYPPHFGAGHWIYKGYQAAWEHLGYDVIKFPSQENFNEYIDVSNIAEDYTIMTVDSTVKPDNLHLIERAYRAYIYVQPNNFPLPWGAHPNFSCLASEDIISSLNKADNAYLWTFGDGISYHSKWKHVNIIPLGLDSINYRAMPDKNYEYDVCFVGGWANNGFNEKRKIMLEWFRPFTTSGLKCGIFINKNLTHEQENLVLWNSRVAINIHDAYQQALKLDTNERTFKSLGLAGNLVSDNITQINRLFPDVPLVETPEEMISLVRKYLDMDPEEMQLLKNKNRKMIAKEHSYIQRVKTMTNL